MRRLYDSRRWRKNREIFLADNPLCIMCERQGRVTAATIVDHIVPHDGDVGLFWDMDNWQSLCASCHSGVKRIADLHGHSQACGADGFPIDPGHPWAKPSP